MNAVKSKIGFGLLLSWIGGGVLLTICNQIWFLSTEYGSEQLVWDATSKYIITTAAYIVIIILVWFEIDNLKQFHLDFYSLLILVIFGPLFRKLSQPLHQNIFWLLIVFASITLLIILIRNRSKIPETNTKWLADSVFKISLVIVLITLLEGWLQPASYSLADPKTYHPWIDVIGRIVHSLASTASIEEIIFRGFLWGYLIRFGWNERQAIWGQAIVFWLIHFAQLFYAPITFFIIVPISIVLFSIIVRNTKQVFWAIIVHTVINVVIPVALTLYFL